LSDAFWRRSTLVTQALPPRQKSHYFALGKSQDLQIDGRLLRTGAANFSASGVQRQDNDLIIIENTAAAAEFRRHFEAIFAESEPLPIDGAPRRNGFSGARDQSRRTVE
jgi:hypothetical protein